MGDLLARIALKRTDVEWVKRPSADAAHLAVDDTHAQVEGHIQSHKSALALLALALLAGRITKAAFIDRATSLLTAGIVQTAQAGGASKDEAATLADQILTKQTKRIDGLAADLDASTLPSDDDEGSGLSVAQGRLFAGGLAGTLWAGYQAARVLTADDDASDEAKEATFDYECPNDRNSCDDCVDRADNGPYTRDELPSYPGDGSTACGGNDRCRIVLS